MLQIYLDYVILITFPRQKSLANAPHYYVDTFISCPVYSRWTKDTSRVGYCGMLIGKWSPTFRRSLP